MRKNVALIMCMVMTLCTVMCLGVPVQADTEVTYRYKGYDEEEFTDTWNGFDCKIDEDNQTIILRRYQGSVEDLVIPKTATIDGTEYIIRFNDNCSYFFDNSSILKSVSFEEGIDTSDVTDMEGMFARCDALESVDLSNFNTGNVTNMLGLFSGCTGLTHLDLSGFSTGNVTTMEGMFVGCTNLKSVDVSSFDTSNVTDMSYMFMNCESLESLDVSNFDTGKVSYMMELFCNCKSLKNLDLSNFNTGVTSYMERMFGGCTGLESVDVSSFNTSRVKRMSGMFGNCKRLKILDVDNFDMSKVEDTDGFITNCESLVKINIPLNLKLDTALPVTFAREDDKTVTYTSLPLEQTESFTIVRSSIPVEGITISPTVQSLTVGSSFTIIPTVLPVNATNRNVTFESSNESIATVDSDGVVTGVGDGVAVITVTTVDGGLYAECEVTVGKDAPIYTAPKAVTVTYTGSAQNMAVAGSTTDGTMYYAISSSATVSPRDSAWSTAVPKATDEGTYYVWYKITGDEDHGDISPTYIGTPSVINPQSKNVIEIDERAGTALVYDDTAGRNVIVPIDRIKKGEVYRLYDYNRGEHFYTQDVREKEILVRLGWRLEASEDFYSVEAIDADALPVYRLYNPNGGGMHMFTTDSKGAVDLRRQGWTYEGIAFYVYKTTSLKGTEQYRLYNPYSPSGEHVWTSDETGRDYLKKIGWHYEGVAWKVL